LGLGYCSGQRAETKNSVILVPSLSTDEREKWCWKCKQFKPISQFYRDATKYDGIKDICKICDNKGRVERERKKAEKDRANLSKYTKRPDYFGVTYKNSRVKRNNTLIIP